MSYTINLTRAALAAISIGTLGAAATADHSAAGVASWKLSGDGAGTVHLPTENKNGLMVGVLVAEKLGTRYTIQAELTSFLPIYFDPSHGIALGGIYGRIDEVTDGGLLGDPQPQFSAWVDGVWHLGRDLTGTYEALVLARSESGTIEVRGMVRGKFQVAAIDDAKGPRLDDAGGGGRTKSPGLGDISTRGSNPKIAPYDGVGGAPKQPTLSDSDSVGSVLKRPALSDSSSSRSAQKPSLDDAASGQNKLPAPAPNKIRPYGNAAAGQFGNPQPSKESGDGAGTFSGGPALAGSFQARFTLVL